MLQAKSIITYNNVEMESSGVLTKVVTQTGDADEFKRLSQQAGIEWLQVRHMLHLIHHVETTHCAASAQLIVPDE